MNKETKISRVYETKNGEVIVSFKYQFGELTMQEKEDLKMLWREDVSLNLAIERFQEVQLDGEVWAPEVTAYQPLTNIVSPDQTTL